MIHLFCPAFQRSWAGIDSPLVSLRIPKIFRRFSGAGQFGTSLLQGAGEQIVSVPTPVSGGWYAKIRMTGRTGRAGLLCQAGKPDALFIPSSVCGDSNRMDVAIEIASSREYCPEATLSASTWANCLRTSQTFP
jgi:hypothetical protein